MPAEWQPQSAVWFSWPHNVETWPENLNLAQAEFVQLVATIANSQLVKILVADDQRAAAKTKLNDSANIEFVSIPTNDAWARDYAPTFVKSGEGDLVAINWHYNAWGGKYPPFDDDQKVATRVAEFLDIQCVSPEFCFEGGAIDVNDSGVLLCTKSCALDPNRNPGKSLQDVETLLHKNLGTSICLWLSGDALAGDDTEGHVDQLARFTDDQTIVYAWSDDSEDPQSNGLAQNLRDLQSALKENNLEHICLVPLPIPEPMELFGRRVPASYCNFLITNTQVLVPTFQVPQDRLAMEILKPLFPGRAVIGLPSKNLSVGLGSFHCLSQQQPA